MEKTYLEENIFCVENFISDEECKKILSMDLEWVAERQDLHQNILISRFSNLNDRQYFDKVVEDRICSLLNDENQKFRKRRMLTKYLAQPTKCECPQCKENGGHALSWHYENHPECDYESRWITLGVVLYFNDDYDGGELVFQNKPIKLKPKKNSLMVFPATEEYSHAVEEVLGKERIVFAGFVYAKQYWDILERSGYKDQDSIF